MTIIQPNKYRSLKHFLIILFLILLAGGVFYIYEYNKFVDVRYQADFFKEQIIKAQALNADLKNQLYQITDPANLQSLAQKQGLFLEKKPDYLKLAVNPQ